MQAEEIIPMVTWGTSPEDVITINDKVPNPDNEKDIDKKNSINEIIKIYGFKT